MPRGTQQHGSSAVSAEAEVGARPPTTHAPAVPKTHREQSSRLRYRAPDLSSKAPCSCAAALSMQAQEVLHPGLQ